jgi:hypothetical protein
MLGFALTLLYLAFTFLRPQELYLWLSPYEVMNVLAAVALAGTILNLVIGDRPRPPVVQLLLVIGLLIWAPLTLVLALRWFGGALIAWDRLSINAFVFLLIVLNVSTLRRVAALRVALIVLVLALLGMCLYSYSTGWRSDRFVLLDVVANPSDPRLILMEGYPENPEGTTAMEDPDREQRRARYIKRLRALGFLNDPNDLAQMLIITLPFVLVGYRRRRFVGNMTTVLAPAAFLVLGIILTGSRGGLVALAALVWAATAGRFRGRISLALNLIGLAALATLAVLSTRLGQLDASAAGRVEAWSAGLQMLKASPVWGVGFGMFADQHGRVAHNSFVHTFAELGVVGYFLWLGTLVVTFQGLARLRRAGDDPEGGVELSSLASATRLALVGFLVASIFLSRGYSPTLFIVLGISTALIGAGLRRRVIREPSLVQWVPVTLFLLGLSVVMIYLTIVLGK